MRDLRNEIPENWKRIKIKDLIKDLKAGISVNSGDRPCKNGEVGVLKTSSLNNGRFIPEENKVIIDREERERAKRKPKAGSIIISRMNTPELVGDIGFVQKDYENLFLPDRLWLAKFKEDSTINIRWLSYKLTSPEVRHNIKSIATGTSGSMKNISQKSFLNLPVTIPTKTEQDITVEIVSTWDKAISTLNKLIKAKKRYKKGLMQQLLSPNGLGQAGKKRFPEFEDEPWIEMKLGEVFNERKEKDCTHLDLVAITTDNGVIDRDELDRKDTSSSNKDKYKRIAPGDIGYNTMRMWQGVSGYSELEGIVSPAYTIVTPVEDKVDGCFMSYLFKYPPIIDLFRRYSQGLVSDTLNLKYNNFAQIKVTIPKSIKEQKKIRNTLLAADQEIELLKEKLKAIKKQKKGLMQKLLTGKVRVNKKLNYA